MDRSVTPKRKAAAASGGGVVALAVVWLLGRYGVRIDAEGGVVIGGCVVSVARYVAKHGIVGAVRQLWRGAAS